MDAETYRHYLTRAMQPGTTDELARVERMFRQWLDLPTEVRDGPKDVAQTAEQIARRFDWPLAAAQTHIGDHICLDGRWYRTTCLVSDPDCDWVARAKLAKQGGQVAYRGEG